MKCLRLLGVLVISLALEGCASITSSEIQPITVSTLDESGEEVKTAKCSLRNDKGEWKIETPTVVDVRKSFSDLSVECQKEGLEDGSATVVSRATIGLYGNIIIGGLIGAAIDHSRGTAYEYPKNLSVIMGEKKFIHTGSAEFNQSAVPIKKRQTSLALNEKIDTSTSGEDRLRGTVLSCTQCLGIDGCPYTDNGNGTVTDIRNNRVWMRCSYGQQWNGETCQGTPQEVTLRDAENIGKGIYIDNRIGWRLPYESEMKSLLSTSCMPTINTDAFPNTPAGDYATYDDTKKIENARFFNLKNGENFRLLGRNNSHMKSYVRFVRN
jgi:hypothetical protein